MKTLKALASPARVTHLGPMNQDSSNQAPTVTLVGPHDGREIPWGNRGGSSRELILRTQPDRQDRLLWRMSTTCILGSSPFSTYTGFTRTITLLSGGAFTLDFFGQVPAHTVARFEPFDFNGGWQTHCHLPGEAASVLNVMTDDSVIYSHTLLKPAVSASPHQLGSEAVLLYALEGSTRLASTLDLPVALLKAGEMLAFENATGASLDLASDADAKILCFTFAVQR